MTNNAAQSIKLVNTNDTPITLIVEVPAARTNRAAATMLHADMDAANTVATTSDAVYDIEPSTFPAPIERNAINIVLPEQSIVALNVPVDEPLLGSSPSRQRDEEPPLGSASADSRRSRSSSPSNERQSPQSHEVGPTRQTQTAVACPESRTEDRPPKPQGRARNQRSRACARCAVRGGLQRCAAERSERALWRAEGSAGFGA